MSASNTSPFFASDEDRQQFFSISGELGRVFLILMFLFGAMGFYLGFFEPSVLTYRCDAEITQAWRGKQAFVQDGQYFSQGRFQSEDYAHSGRYSLMLSLQNPYGFQMELPTLNGGDEILMTVWGYFSEQKPMVKLSLGIQGGPTPGGAEIEKQKKDGWVKLKFWYKIQPQDAQKQTKFYIWNWGNKVAYLDDLTIQINRAKP